MYSKNNILNVNGANMRKIEFEAIQTLYDLTKDTNDKFGYVDNDIARLLMSKKPEELTFEFLVGLLGDTRNQSKGGVEKSKSIVVPQMKMRVPKAQFMNNEKEFETTVGKFIYNKMVVERLELKDVLGYVDWQLTDSGNHKVEGILASALLNDKMTVQQFFRYLDVRDWFGEQMHFVLTPSFTMGILKTPKNVKDLKDKLIKDNKEALHNGDVLLAEKIEKQILGVAKETLKDDPGMDLYNSEARGSFKNNYKNINLLKGPVFNSGTGKYDFVESSYMDGIKKQDISVYGNAVVQGAYPKAVGTQVSGYFAKKILAALQTEMLDVAGSDCGTKLTVPFKLTEKNARDFYYRFIVDGGKLVELTPEVIPKYYNKVVHLRSVMFCKNPKSCNCCAGNMFYKLGIDNIGLTSSRVATTLTKLGMKRFHDATVNAEQIDPDSILL